MSDLTIYKQIYPSQCQKLVKLGFASVINVRPDGEADNQPRSTVLAKACEQVALEYVYVPFTNTNVNANMTNSKQNGGQNENQDDNFAKGESSVMVEDDDICPRLNHATIKQFAQAYHTLPKPILLFCGTGSRAKLLYQTAVLEGFI